MHWHLTFFTVPIGSHTLLIYYTRITKRAKQFFRSQYSIFHIRFFFYNKWIDLHEIARTMSYRQKLNQINQFTNCIQFYLHCAALYTYIFRCVFVLWLLRKATNVKMFLLYFVWFVIIAPINTLKHRLVPYSFVRLFVSLSFVLCECHNFFFIAGALTLTAFDFNLIGHRFLSLKTFTTLDA